MNKKILVLLVLLIVLLIPIMSFATYYGLPITIEGDSLGGVKIFNGDTPFPLGSVNPVDISLRKLPSTYLKIVDGVIVEKTEVEKAFLNLPLKYKKQVDGIWVEMTSEEKHLLDLPAKYKHEDGTEMTQEEKDAVDLAEQQANEAEAIALEEARQLAKHPMLKQVENLYVTFLTNDWTNILRAKNIISAETTITVDNTSTENIIYLMTLRAQDRDNYIKFASEFKLFEDTMKEKFYADISNARWHPEIVGE